MTTLEDRVSSLERTVHRYRVGTAALVASLLVLATMSATFVVQGSKPDGFHDVIRARLIEVGEPGTEPVVVLDGSARTGSPKGSPKSQPAESRGFPAVTVRSHGHECTIGRDWDGFAISLSRGEKVLAQFGVVPANGGYSGGTYDNSSYGSVSVRNSVTRSCGVLWASKSSGVVGVNDGESKRYTNVDGDGVVVGDHPHKASDGTLVHSQNLIELKRAPGGVGGAIVVRNKTGEPVVTMEADEYGNGVVGAWDRKGKGRTLKPGQ